MHMQDIICTRFLTPSAIIAKAFITELFVIWSATHVVLFGDSHAQQWTAALEEAARERDWRVTTYLRASCTPNAAVMVVRKEEEQARCHGWAVVTLSASTWSPARSTFATIA